jgi:hypothetical protein
MFVTWNCAPCATRTSTAGQPYTLNSLTLPAAQQYDGLQQQPHLPQQLLYLADLLLCYPHCMLQLLLLLPRMQSYDGVEVTAGTKMQEAMGTIPFLRIIYGTHSLLYS